MGRAVGRSKRKAVYLRRIVTAKTPKQLDA
jgi:hypothetical protein